MNALNEQQQRATRAADVVETSLKRFSESVQRILNLSSSSSSKRRDEDVEDVIHALSQLEMHLKSAESNKIFWTEELGKTLYESVASFLVTTTGNENETINRHHARAMRVTSLAIQSSKDKEIFKECLNGGSETAKKLFVNACLKKLSGGVEGGGDEKDDEEKSAIDALVSLCCDAKAITKTFLVTKLNVDVKTSSVKARVNACKVIQEICEKSSLSWDCTNAVKKLKQLLLLSDDDAEPMVKDASLRACVALRNSRVDDFTERQGIERALLETNGMSPKTRKALERAFEGGGYVTTTTTNKRTGEDRLLEMRSPINPNETTPARRLRKQSERLQKFQSDDALPKEAFLTQSTSKSKQKQEAEENALSSLECTQHVLETIAEELHQSSSEWEKRVLGCKKIVKLCTLQNNKFRQFCKDASIVIKKQNGSIKKFGETNAVLLILDKLSYAVHDKRSSVARAGCQAVLCMAQRLKGDLSDEFLDILLPSLFKAIIVSVGVISDSGDACVSEIVRNCFGGSSLDDEGPKVHLARVFAEEIVSPKVSKIAKLRAKCALYLSECFEVGLVGSSHLPKPVADIASVAIEKALEDADATVRGNAKLAYEKFHRVVDESYFDAFTQQLDPEIKRRLALASSSEKKNKKNKKTIMAGSDEKSNEMSLQDAMRERKRKLQQEKEQQKDNNNSKGELTEVIELNAILAAQNNMKAYNDRIGQPVDDDFTIDLPPRMLSIQTPMSIKPALKKHTALVEEASKRATTTATATISTRMAAIKESEFDVDVDAEEGFRDNNNNNNNKDDDDSIDSSLPPRERLGRSLAQTEVADSPPARAKAAERLRDALEDMEQLLSKNTDDDDDKEGVEAISADFVLRAATTLARFCADDVTESRCFVPALEAIVALTNVSSLRIKIASSSSAMEASNNSFMKEFKFAFAESTKILAGPLFGRLAGQNPNARTSAQEALISLARNVDLETGLLPSLRRAFVSIEATESDVEKCDRARTGVAQFSGYALSTKNLSKKKIAHLAEGSDELKNWANTLAKCASRCVSVSSKSNLYDACVDALRVVCFEIDQETVEKIVANYESIKADVLLKKSNADVLERSSKKKNKKTKKASSTTPENIDGKPVDGGEEENDASTSLAGRTPGACLDKSTGRSRKSFGTRKTPVSTINTDNSIPMTISPSPILGGGDASTRMNVNDNNNNNNNEASFGLDVSQMNNLMPPTTVKKNLLLTKMSGQHSSVVKSAAPTPGPVSARTTPNAAPTIARVTGKPQTQSLGVGARVMRALDCLKKEEDVSTIDDRRDVLRSLLEMVQLEYSAFKPFVTLLAPTLVKVAETDLDGVCRFYARRVLFRAFERATDGDDKIENEESAIVDAVTSLVPIFVDQTTQTSLRCLKLLLEKVTRKESVEKILDLVGSYVYEKAGVSSSPPSPNAKREACECVAIALSKLCDENEEDKQILLFLNALLERDLYSLNVFGDEEKKVIASIAKALMKQKNFKEKVKEEEQRGGALNRPFKQFQSLVVH
jgi:hypothetical protein